MQWIKSIVAMAFGGGLAIVAGTEALGAGGLDPNLRLVYGWSLLVILGLYLVGWGLMTFVSSSDTDGGSDRPSSSRHAALDTRPSAGSSAKRQGPSNRWYDSDR